MAGQFINLTRNIITLNNTAASYSSASTDVLEASGLAGIRLDFEAKIFLLTGTSPSVVFTLETSMYNDPNAIWLPLGTFSSAVTASNTVKSLSVTTGVLKFIRWTIVPTNMTLISFEILGMGW